jgi:type IV pilus assembly protein PilB
MGIEPFLIASTVRTVIGQRLVRRIGANKETYESDKVETEAIHKTIGHLLPKTQEEVAKVAQDLGYETLPLATQSAYTLTRGKDSPEQPGGYKGRMGIYEVFSISEPVQELILKHSTSSEIQRAAKEQGMITMREDGYLKALAGQTTLTEINRVASTDAA